LQSENALPAESQQHPETGEEISFPYTKLEMLIPALYGILTPVCLDVAPGIRMLHCTSDILGVLETKDHIEITLYGDRDLYGEIVFEGPGVSRIKSASIDNDPVKIISDSKRIAIAYAHAHRRDIKLTLS